MDHATLKILLIFTCFVPILPTEITENRQQNIGIATDLVASYIPPTVEVSNNKPVNEEPQIDQEISSPGLVILPNHDQANENVYETAASAEDIISPESSSSLSSSELPINGVDALILTWYRMQLNESRNAGYMDESFQHLMPSPNCTYLSCLYGTDAEVSTLSATDRNEIEETTTVPDDILEEENKSDNETDNVFDGFKSSTDENFVASENHGIVINPILSQESPIVHDVENDSNESIMIPEEERSSPSTVISDKRLSFGGLSFLSGSDSFEELQEKPEQEPPIVESKRTITDQEMNFVMSERILPSWNMTKVIPNMEVPDVVRLLKRCGVFPACSLSVIASDDVVNYDAYWFEKGFSKKITSEPEFLTKTAEVTCDITSVSIMVAFTIVLAIIVIISNFIIMVVTLRTRSLRKPHGYFKISLAVADFLTGAFILTNISSNLVRFIYFNQKDINQLQQLRRLEPSYGEAMFFGICAVLSQVATVYSVLLLSVDSFMSIRWPMQYRIGDLMTTKRATGLIALVWLCAFLVSSLPILAHEYVRYGLSYATFSYFPLLKPLESHMSQEDAFMARYIHVILYAVLVWGIPFLATWLLTLLTAYHSRGMLRNMSAARSIKGQAVNKRIGRLEKDILRTVSIVLVMLTITVLPMLATLVAVSLTAYDNLLCMEQEIVDLLFAAYYILVCGSFVNVIVYNACHKEFRRAMMDFLCDAISFMFSWMCPGFCDLRTSRNRRTFRSRGTRRTTFSSNTQKKRHFIGSSLHNSSTNDRSGTLQSSLPGTLPPGSSLYGVIGCHKNMCSSDSLSSDHPSSSRTVSTDTAISDRDQSVSTVSSVLSRQVNKKPPAQRAASCGPAFLPSAHTENRDREISTKP